MSELRKLLAKEGQSAPAASGSDSVGDHPYTDEHGADSVGDQPDTEEVCAHSVDDEPDTDMTEEVGAHSVDDEPDTDMTEEVGAHSVDDEPDTGEDEGLMSRAEMPNSINSTMDSEDQHGIVEVMPKELTMEIFSYLTPQELCLCVAPVCRTWNECAHDPSLWQTLEVPSVSCLPLSLMKQCLSCLKTISIADYRYRRYDRKRVELSIGRVWVLAQFCPQLEELNLRRCKGPMRQIFQCFVKKCPKLQSLSVPYCYGMGKHGKTFIKVLGKAPSLQNFNFSHCHLDDVNLLDLSKHIKKIQHLNLEGNPGYTDSSLKTLLENHKECLTSLVVDCCQKWSDSTFEALGDCKHLRKLSMSFYEPGESYFPHMTDAGLDYVKKLCELRRLKLHGFYFNAEGLLSFFNTGNLSKLTVLDLNYCTELGDDALIAAAECCGQSLRSLRVAWCSSVTDRGISAIIDHCSSLVDLSLMETHLTEAILQRVPEALPCLRELNPIPRGSTNKAIKQLNSRMPDLKVNFNRDICTASFQVA